MDIRRITRSPVPVPAAALLATALMLAANPGRQQVLHSLYGRLHEPVRLIPLAPDAMIPNRTRCSFGGGFSLALH